MDPHTDRGERTIGLTLYVRVVGLDETVGEEGVEQQVKTKRCSRKRFEAQANQGSLR